MSDPKFRIAGPSGAITNPGGPNQFAWFDSANILGGLPQWYIDPLTDGAQVNILVPVDDTGFHLLHNFEMLLQPTIASPTATWRNMAIVAEIDPTSTGLPIGTAGQAVQLFDLVINHSGTSNTGGLSWFQLEGNLGNTTDPITIQGLTYVDIFTNVAADVTIDGGINGYGFQLNVDAAAILAPNNSYINAFFDSGNFQNTVYGYNSFSANPNVDTMANNYGYTAFSSNPNITTMLGNASYIGLGIYGNVTNLGTGGFTGINMNPTLGTFPANSGFTGINIGCQITAMGTIGSWGGVFANPTIAVSHGFVSGFAANPNIAAGDANVTLFSGNMSNVTGTGTPTVLQMNGLTADGKQSGFNADNVRVNFSGILTPISAAGVYSQNTFFVQMTTPNSTTITGTDIIVNILSPGIDMGNASSYIALGPNGLGVNMVGFAGQVSGHGGMDQLSSLLAGAIFADDFTLPEWRNVNALLINAGYTGTCTNATAFYHEVAGAGLFATNHWGFRIVTDMDNYVTRLAINTTSQKVSNASVGLEIGGTDRAFLNARVTSAQKTALTPLDGMQVYDTDIPAFQFRENGVWVGLGSGGTSTNTSNVRAPEGGGTVTLTNADNPSQTFDLNASEMVVLPTTGISKDDLWTMINPNPFQLQIQASDATVILNSWGAECTLVALVNTPVTSTDWKVVQHTVLFGRSWQAYTLPTSAGTGILSSSAKWCRPGIDSITVYFQIVFSGINTSGTRFLAACPNYFSLNPADYPDGSAISLGTAWYLGPANHKYGGDIVPAFDQVTNPNDAFQFDLGYGAGNSGGNEITTLPGNGTTLNDILGVQFTFKATQLSES